MSTNPIEDRFRDVARALIAGQIDERITLGWNVFKQSLTERAHRPRVVCISGSMRFEQEMREAAVEESLAGHIVVMPHVNMKLQDPRWADEQDTERIKTSLDSLHFAKIDLADEVLVVCPGDYIGDSTRREIDYAEEHRKPVRYRREGVGPVRDIAEFATMTDLSPEEGDRFTEAAMSARGPVPSTTDEDLRQRIRDLEEIGQNKVDEVAFWKERNESLKKSADIRAATIRDLGVQVADLKVDVNRYRALSESQAGELADLRSRAVVSDARINGQADLIGRYQELLAYIELHVNWRYVTGQCTTEQRELWALTVEAQSDEPVSDLRWWSSLDSGKAEAPADPIWVGPDLVREAGLKHVDVETREKVFDAFNAASPESAEGSRR